MKAALTPKLLINIGILLLVFSVSVLVRLDNLKDPMGRHHEWLTGHVLSTVSIFETDGTPAHYYAPVWTFNTDADRYVQSKQTFKDKNNYTYYVSYPPLCFLLPHFIFKLCGTQASVIGIRILGLAIHFFTGLFIFLLILSVFKKRMRSDLFVPAFIGFCLYLFASGNLWFHSHVFFADMLVPLFVASFLLVVLKTLNNDYSFRKSAILLALCCFLGTYTEWQMLFVAFFTGVLFFLKGFKERRYFILFLIVGVFAVLPVLLTYYQYSKIAGFDELVDVLSYKYKQRSGTGASAEAGLNMYNSFSYENISNHYETNYSTLLTFAWYCLLCFACIAIINKLRKEKPAIVSPTPVLLILLLSILLHHVVFFNFTTVHDFSTLKSSLFLSLFSAYAIGLLFLRIEASEKTTKYVFYLFTLCGLGFYIHFSISAYYSVNHISTLFKTHQMVGSIVQKHMKPTEIAITNAHTSPETSWYAKRNLIEADSYAGAVDVLSRIHSTRNGAYIVLGAADYEVIKFNTKGDTLSYIKKPISSLLNLQ